MTNATRSKLLIVTAVMASLLEIIDTSIVNVAIPTMMGNLGATLDEISWVITGYIIANAIVLPIAGWMSQQIGRKRYYTGCIILFTAASVACGLAPNLPVLVIFRVIQGFAGGALLPTSQSLIYESFPKEKAGMASAIYGMSVMIGPTVGPTLGGYLTDNLGWRSIFNVNLPIGIVVAILSFLLVEDVGYDPSKPKAESRPVRQKVPVDALGLFLLVAAVGCLQYVLERGNAEDWFAATSITLSTIAGVVALIGLIWWEMRAPHPILELKHFRNPTFRSGVLLMSAVGAFLYGLIFLIPVFVDTVFGFTATQTGELFIPGALAAAFMMPLIGSQLRKRDPRIFIAIGISLGYLAAFFIGRFDGQTSVHGMFWPLLVRGVAMAYLFVPVNSTVLSQFSGVAIGQAAGMLNLCRQLGGSIGIAVFGTLLQHFNVHNYTALSEHITPFDPTARNTLHQMQLGMGQKFPGAVGLSPPASGAIAGIGGAIGVAGLKVLYFRVKKEAFILSFQKVMRLLAMVFSSAMIPMAFLRPGRGAPPKPGEAMDAH